MTIEEVATRLDDLATAMDLLESSFTVLDKRINAQAAKTQTTEKKIVRIGERLHDMRERFDASQEMLIERLVIVEARLDRVVPVVTAMFAAPNADGG